MHPMVVAIGGARRFPPLMLLTVNAVLVAALAAGQAVVALALAVVAPLLVAVVRRPQRGLLVLATLAPFNGLLVLAPGASFLAGWKELLVVLTLGATFVAPAEARAPVGRRLPPWTPAVAGLLGVALVSASVVGGLQALIGMKILFFYGLVAVAVWRCPPNAAERDHLVTLVMLTAGITAVIGLAQQVAGTGRLHEFGYEYNTVIRTTGGFLRSFSTFNQPFGFAFFLMLALLIGIPAALSDPSRWRSRAFLASVPVLVVALGFTFVRGAWIGVAVGLMYLGFTRHPVLLLALPLGVVALLYLPSEISAPAFSSSSSSERLSSWQERTSQALSNPLGIGVGASGSASEKVATLEGSGEEYQPDNFYFKILLELGVVGVWLLVLLLVSTFATARSAASRLQGQDAALSSGVAAAVLAAAVASVVATYFEIFPMDMFFWLLCAVVATLAPSWRVPAGDIS